MSSTILYRFRSGTTFEALPLPGSVARLFDVKKAIVLAKKLDQAGSMEFDLSVRDASTDEEYTDENMVLPRGTRLVIQRLPAARGHGFLTRMTRHPYGASVGGATAGGPGGTGPPNTNFYTIDSRAHGEEDEFVSAARLPVIKQEDQELAALRAATDAATQAARNVALRPGQLNQANFRTGNTGHGQPPPPPPPRPPPHGRQQGNFVPRQRLNADPELREQEKQLMPKKRATGIPRTFLNLNAPPQTGEGSGIDGEGNVVPLLQPNAIGFEELVNRGGGQSENTGGSMRDLDYALKLTATTVPEYLQCAICHNVVRDAMMLPWDPEGRTTCESCIRDALTQNGFRCPLTGQEGVSPDDLLPNHALRKAADQFVKEVMEKMEEIEKQQVDEDDDMPSGGDPKRAGSILDGEGADKGVIITKRTSIADRKKKIEEDDPFGAGGDDLFGGDVFAVANEDKDEEEDELAPKAEASESKEQANQTKKDESSTPAVETEETSKTAPEQQIGSVVKTETKEHASDEHAEDKLAERVSGGHQQPQRRDNRTRSLSPVANGAAREKSPSEAGSRREARRRGPPIGYSMGPAGGAVSGPREDANTSSSAHNDTSTSDDRDHGFRGGGRKEGRRSRRDKEDYEEDHPHGDPRRSNNDDYGRPRQFPRGGRGRGRGRGRDHHGDHVSDNNTGSQASLDDKSRHHHKAHAIDHHGDPRGMKRPRSDSDGDGGSHYGETHRGGYHDDRYGYGGGGGGGGPRGGFHGRERYDPYHGGGGGRGGPGRGPVGGGGGFRGGFPGGGRGYFDDRGGRGGGFRGGPPRGGPPPRGGGGGRGGYRGRGRY